MMLLPGPWKKSCLVHWQIHDSAKWLIGFLVIYTIACLSLLRVYHIPLKDLLVSAGCFGFLLSIIAWWLVRRLPVPPSQPPQKYEPLILALFIAWVVLYITFGASLINHLLPKKIRDNNQWQFVIIIGRKLLVFFIIPFAVYKTRGLPLKDFGLSFSPAKLFTKMNMIILAVMSIIIILLQYFLSGGAQPLRDGKYSGIRLAIAFPLSFGWLLIEAGLCEEFFFRAILQSRIAVLLKSEWGAILLGGLLFGLAHVPGLYLRGAGSEDVTEQMPLLFWIFYCITNMSVAGIFLGIIWSRTRNLCLVMALHAVTDLLPNVADFIHLWHI